MKPIRSSITHHECKWFINSSHGYCQKTSKCAEYARINSTGRPDLACPCEHPFDNTNCPAYEERRKIYRLYDDSGSLIEMFDSAMSAEKYIAGLQIDESYW